MAGQQEQGAAEQQQQHEDVVVLATQPVDQGQRVQPHDGHRERPRPAECARDRAHERDTAQRRSHHRALEDPVGGRERELGQRVRGEGEQRPVGAGQATPRREGIGRVVTRLQRDVRVGVEVVHRPEAGVAEVVEEVGEGEGRAQEEQDVEHHDGSQHPRRAQGRHACEDDRVEHQQHEDRDREVVAQHQGVVRQARDQGAQWPGVPAGEAALARRRERGPALGGREHDRQAGRHQAGEAEHPDPRAHAGVTAKPRGRRRRQSRCLQGRYQATSGWRAARNVQRRLPANATSETKGRVMA